MKINEKLIQVINKDNKQFYLEMICLNKKKGLSDWLLYTFDVIETNKNEIIDTNQFDEFNQLKEYLKDIYNVKVFKKNYYKELPLIF